MKTIVIAEAGVNHNGSLIIAKKMIKVAKDCGADFVKFQSFKAQNIVTKNSEMAEYQKTNLNDKKLTQFEMLKKLEINKNFHISLIRYCKKINIKFLSTPFDIENIELLNQLKLSYLKIPSGEITNYPYLKKIGSLNKKIFISTGMSTLNEIKSALDILLKSGTKKNNIYILHCNTAYPTPYKDVNLRAMQTIKDKFGNNVGYSDHSLGDEVSICAVALGAKVIEKHFTLSRKMIGPDHVASLEPSELKVMIDKIRNIEKSLGSKIKKISRSEKINKKIARKSIVAKKYIKKGETFSENNITVKRPGNGLSPMNWKKVIGKKSKKNFKPDQQIKI